MIDQKKVAELQAIIKEMQNAPQPKTFIKGERINFVDDNPNSILINIGNLLDTIQKLGKEIKIDTSKDELSQLRQIRDLKKSFDENFSKIINSKTMLNEAIKKDLIELYTQITTDLLNLAGNKKTNFISTSAAYIDTVIHTKESEQSSNIAQAQTDFNALKTYLNNHVIDTKSKSPAMTDLIKSVDEMGKVYIQPISDDRRNEILAQLKNKIGAVQESSKGNFSIGISKLRLFVQRKGRTATGAANALKVINHFMEKKEVDGKKAVDVITAINMVDKDGEKRLNINMGNKTFKR